MDQTGPVWRDPPAAATGNCQHCGKRVSGAAKVRWGSNPNSDTNNLFHSLLVLGCSARSIAGLAHSGQSVSWLASAEPAGCNSKLLKLLPEALEHNSTVQTAVSQRVGRGHVKSPSETCLLLAQHAQPLHAQLLCWLTCVFTAEAGSGRVHSQQP
jgi:hypothetical protein